MRISWVRLKTGLENIQDGSGLISLMRTLIVPVMPSAPTAPAPNRRSFWDKHPGLVWSNRHAPDDAFISAALRKNRFLQLLDIAREFGPDRLRQQWQRELAEGDIPEWFATKIEENLQIIEQAKADVDSASAH